MPLSTMRFAENLARDTGQLLKDYFQNHQLFPEIKKDHTLVTGADLEADRFIRDALQKNFPGDGVLTEESSTRYPSGQKVVWVIDPLDGTTNFSLGLHYWGVSIARLEDGFPQTAALYFPLLDELYSARKGKGAWFNREPLAVQNPRNNSPNSFFACCSRTYQEYQVRLPYKTRMLGSAAYHLCAVAGSKAITACEVTPKLWDIAGAWLIVQEAGGAIQTLDGSHPFPAQPGVDYQNLAFPTVAAATASLEETALKHITIIQ